MSTASAKYFIWADGKQLGPFSGQEIRTKLFQNNITADDYVWQEGIGTRWVKINTILDELPDGVTPPAPEGSEDDGSHAARTPDSGGQKASERSSF